MGWDADPDQLLVGTLGRSAISSIAGWDADLVGN